MRRARAKLIFQKILAMASPVQQGGSCKLVCERHGGVVLPHDMVIGGVPGAISCIEGPLGAHVPPGHSVCSGGALQAVRQRRAAHPQDAVDAVDAVHTASQQVIFEGGITGLCRAARRPARAV